MTYTAKVQNGVIVVDGDIRFPEGCRLLVAPVDAGGQASASEGGSIWNDLKELAGSAEGLPEDMADNHDHYIHGTEKRVLE